MHYLDKAFGLSSDINTALWTEKPVYCQPLILLIRYSALLFNKSIFRAFLLSMSNTFFIHYSAFEVFVDCLSDDFPERSVFFLIMGGIYALIVIVIVICYFV